MPPIAANIKVTVVGAGYVFLVTGVCMAEMGSYVMRVDVEAGKIELLPSGDIPTHEPWLEALVQRNAAAGWL